MFQLRISSAFRRRLVSFIPALAAVMLLPLFALHPQSVHAQPSEGNVPFATLSLSPPIQSQPLGATVAVDVNVADVTDLAAYDFTLTFDKTILAYASVTDAGFLTSTGRTALCSSPPSIEVANDQGSVNFHCNTYGLINNGFGTHGPSGSGVLAHVTFTAIASGASGINFSGVRNGIGDPNVFGYTGLASVESCVVDSCSPIFIGVAAQGASVVVKAACPWDVTGNGDVNSIDLLGVALHFNALEGTGRYDAKYDLNHNGWINSLDMLIVARHFGPCP